MSYTFEGILDQITRRFVSIELLIETLLNQKYLESNPENGPSRLFAGVVGALNRILLLPESAVTLVSAVRSFIYINFGGLKQIQKSPELKEFIESKLNLIIDKCRRLEIELKLEDFFTVES